MQNTDVTSPLHRLHGFLTVVEVFPRVRHRRVIRLALSGAGRSGERRVDQLRGRDARLPLRLLLIDVVREWLALYLASAFRSVRFGINEAHGKGIALQFNYLIDEGAFQYDERTSVFSVNSAKIKDAVRKLTSEIMTVQAEGSYDKAKAMLDKYGVIRPPMQKALDRMKNVPVDIEPIFPLARKRVGRAK